MTRPQRDSDAEEAEARAADQHMRAWLFLVAGLALHVIDEAATGFLDFYNPLVENIRLQLPWFPMPTFSFQVWLAGLIALVLLLAALAPAVRGGGLAIRAASWAFSGIMLLNGLAHLIGSWTFGTWLPGVTSAPLIIVFSVLLARATWRRSSLPPAADPPEMP